MPLPLLGGAAAAALKGGLFRGVAGRFRAPSERRAGKVIPSLVASANGGNATAARAILERTRFGIAKERAEWVKALAQVDPDIVAAVADPRPRGIPRVDHSTPESAAASALSNVYDVSRLATPTSARVKGAKTQAEEDRAVGEGAARSSRRSSSRRSSRRRREEAEPEQAEAYQGRKQTAYERATGERWAARYDPATGERWRIPESDSRYDEWPSRKPRRRRAGAYVSRASQAAGRAVQRGAADIAKAAPAALGVAAVGAIAYLVTTRIMDDAAEGITMDNAYGNAVALAHSEARRRLGREVTRAEHAQLRAAIAEAIQDELDSGSLYGAAARVVRGVLSLFRRK